MINVDEEKRQKLRAEGKLDKITSETFKKKLENANFRHERVKLYFDWQEHAKSVADQSDNIRVFLHREPSDCLVMFRCHSTRGDGRDEYHDIRVSTDLVARIAAVHEDPWEAWRTDSMYDLVSSEVYLVDGPVESVLKITDALNLERGWEQTTCPEYEHTLATGTGTYDEVHCLDCGCSRTNLSYIGHDVPYGEIDHRESSFTIVDDNPTTSDYIKEL
jgi:hypothetical protein